ncbi:MAG: ATP-binding protein [Candidatus Geothermincolia bacterium]
MVTTGEYPHASKAHVALAKSYSNPVLLGPPVSDTLLELVKHMYTDDEADVVQHLKPMRPRTAAGLAKASHRPLWQVEKILDHLAHEMFILLSVGHGKSERFNLMPIVPGTFEAVMMQPTMDSITGWHRRFAELYEALFDTGFLMQYHSKLAPFVRYIPVGEVIDAIPMALPSDRLESILDNFDSFSIALCQCRTSKQILGEGCDRKLDVCTAFGDISKWLVANGKARNASREDVIQTKAEAESQGMVTWMFNVGNESKLNGSCSCCGCCCGALRSITQFNMPGAIAPPHFMPRFDRGSCVACEKCEKVCPVKAIVVTGEGEGKSVAHIPERCIGCGLCAVSCSKSSISMHEAPTYRAPAATWPQFAMKSAPEFVRVIRKVKDQRRQGHPTS